jgi:hypothetical protein
MVGLFFLLLALAAVVLLVLMEAQFIFHLEAVVLEDLLLNVCMSRGIKGML